MFCSKCGVKINDNVNFCANCGKKIEKCFSVEKGNISSKESTDNLNSSEQSSIKKGVRIEYIFDGVLIQVVNKWTKEDLYIDGSLADQHYTGFNAIWGKTLILKAINYPFKSGAKTIQVFCKSGLVTNKFMLCIDNKFVAGDNM